MTRRDIAAAVMGAGAALIVAMALPQTEGSLVSPAQAQTKTQTQTQVQQNPSPEQLRFLILAIANAIASIAVDGERAAMAVNDATDQIKNLEGRLREMEKRLAALEAKR